MKPVRAAAIAICVGIAGSPVPLWAEEDTGSKRAEEGVTPADETALDRLFAQLAEAGPEAWRPLQQEIVRTWSRSGSPSADFLLRRGREALSEGDIQAALDHSGAVTDHAPGFAEGWHLRAAALSRAERLGPALAAVQRALALEPRHFGAMLGLSTILQAMEEPEAALDVLRRAREIHPHHPELRQGIEGLEAIVGDRRA